MELALRRNVSKGQMQPRRVGLFYCFANRDRTGSLQLAFVCIWHSGLRLWKLIFSTGWVLKENLIVHVIVVGAWWLHPPLRRIYEHMMYIRLLGHSHYLGMIKFTGRSISKDRDSVLALEWYLICTVDSQSLWKVFMFWSHLVRFPGPRGEEDLKYSIFVF